MVGPVLTSIVSKWELFDTFSGHVLVELDQKRETCFGDEDMGRFQRDVIARHPAVGNAILCQVFLDRNMRKLYHWRAVHIHDSNEARASRQHHISWVFWSPVPFEREISPFLGFKRKKFGEFFNTERTAGDHNTLEQSMRIFPIFIVDVP